MNLGLTIRMIRKRRGMTQEDLANKADISRIYLSKIENSESNPTIEIMNKICNAFEIPFPVLSFLGMDINSVQEEKREDFLKVKPAIESLIQEVFLTSE